MKAFAASDEMDRRIETYRRSQERLPTESEAIRRLIEIGLATVEASYPEAPSATGKHKAGETASKKKR